MSSESNDKKPGPDGAFKVKLKQPTDERVYLGSKQGDPPGIVCQWLGFREGITLEFQADNWQDPSIWRCVGRTKEEIFLARETSTPYKRVHVRGPSGDGKWRLEAVPGGGTNEWYLVYLLEGTKSYLCDPMKARDDSGHVHLAELKHAAVIELDPPPAG